MSNNMEMLLVLILVAAVASIAMLLTGYQEERFEMFNWGLILAGITFLALCMMAEVVP